MLVIFTKFHDGRGYSSGVERVVCNGSYSSCLRKRRRGQGFESLYLHEFFWSFGMFRGWGLTFLPLAIRWGQIRGL